MEVLERKDMKRTSLKLEEMWTFDFGELECSLRQTATEKGAKLTCNSLGENISLEKEGDIYTSTEIESIITGVILPRFCKIQDAFTRIYLLFRNSPFLASSMPPFDNKLDGKFGSMQIIIHPKKVVCDDGFCFPFVSLSLGRLRFGTYLCQRMRSYPWEFSFSIYSSPDNIDDVMMEPWVQVFGWFTVRVPLKDNVYTIDISTLTETDFSLLERVLKGS